VGADDPACPEDVGGESEAPEPVLVELEKCDEWLLPDTCERWELCELCDRCDE
jgi:hypothetical protein